MKISIKNFRSLINTSQIEIKPITLLLGRNSSGKSSFIRTFPMLKQSVEEKSKSPILLYGNYVDFGSYNDIKPKVNPTSDDSNYELGIFPGNDFENFLTRFRNYYKTEMPDFAEIIKDFEVKLKFCENHKKLIVVERLIAKIYGKTIEILINKQDNTISSIKINNLNILSNESAVNIKMFANYVGGIIPEFYIVHSKDADYGSDPSIFFFKRIEQILKKIGVYKSESTMNSFFRFANKHFSANDEIFLQKLKATTSIKGMKSIVKTWDLDTLEFRLLRFLHFLHFFFEDLIFRFNQYCSVIFTNVKYLAPVRATAERYYRIQHLSINDVDPNGKNLPMFLDSLSEASFKNFQNWTFENFNFKTKIDKIEGHYSIKIVYSDSFEVNLSDTGFGYSQILPVLTQMWYSGNNFNNNKDYFRYYQIMHTPRIIAIEQPELHLHPEFQAKFADSLCKILEFANENDVKLKLIIETHSEVIVNRIGHLILNEKLSKDDVNLVIFNKLQEEGASDISFANYTEDGLINNWPQGFFTPGI